MNALEANRAAYQPGSGRRGHVESWFVKLNSPDGKRALWLKWTLFADGTHATRAECWAISFERGRSPLGGKRSIELSSDAIRSEPFTLAFERNRFDGTHAEGNVATASTEITWSIDLAPTVPLLVPYPYAWMYRAKLPEFKTVTPSPDALAHGWFSIDGVRVDVTGWRAMQGHNWGVRHTHRYAWCHAAGFDEADDVVFEGFSGQLLKAGIELPWLSVASIWVDGRWIRFDRPSTIVSGSVEASVLRWRLSIQQNDVSLIAEATAERTETAALLYANPHAAATYCLNSKLASLRLVLRDRDGTRTFTTKRAALELGWPSADHGIAVVA